jgi:pyruvate,orthophosphate dikinase
MKNLLGGKGANLAEMSLLGIPVPAGFTITTEACTHYYSFGREEVIRVLADQVVAGIHHIEEVMGGRFGDPTDPLLVSVRSGARVSMPGMMDTVLNLGLNDEVVEGMAIKTNNPRAAWDSYRRFVQMYGDVVLGLKPENKEDIDPFEAIIEALKAERGVHLDTDLTTDDLQELTSRFKRAIRSATGKEFPNDPVEQLWGAIEAVFNSWMNDRAITYRRLTKVPESWGTAVNVQAMVFGNMGATSATGVAFSRDPGTGEDEFVGEYLINAQGEDVVAGIRTPQQITRRSSQRWAKLAGVTEEVRRADYPSLEEVMPSLYAELYAIQERLEAHYKDMQDIEFTIQEGRLWMLQTRNGKRTGKAMVKIAMDLLHEGKIDERTALKRIDPIKLDELLHPVFDKNALKEAKPMAQGLPASPGAASGQVVFFADDAVDWAKQGKDVILVRIETSPEDIQGMDAAKGILTTRGGMTSHAAVVARGMGKCCVSGAGALHVDYHNRRVCVGNVCLREGDWLSINGTDGSVYFDRLPTRQADITGELGELMAMADKYARMKVRANADTPHDAQVAREFGAQGIGLCRTEHMFFEGERIKLIREMILAPDYTGRVRALDKLLPIQRKDFEGLFEVMVGLPITIRLLDPPLHEFLPKEEENQRQLAREMGVPFEQVKHKVEELSEINPMLGLRGCRLGNKFPEITEMQTRAIIEAAMNVKRYNHQEVIPEIMVPLVGSGTEFERQAEIIRATCEKVFAERNDRLEFKIGSMIEVPRAAIRADQIALHADFFSFGTNDLTQLTFGYSRDDIADFLPYYLESGILKVDPFQTLDPDGVGYLVKLGTKLGRDAHPGLKVGICGEHGGDPDSIAFCHESGLDYVSCSPFRVPVAKLVAAQVMLKELESAVLA